MAQIVGLSALVALSVDSDGEPPSELRLFKAGKIPTTKREFTYDDESARTSMAAHAAGQYRVASLSGPKVNFDWDHNALFSKGDPSAQRSFGTSDLEARTDGIYATSIQWTDEAKGMIKRKEVIAISPAFLHNNGHITAIHSVALTNNPATHGAQAVVALSDDTITKGNEMDPNETIAALNAQIATLNQANEAKASELDAIKVKAEADKKTALLEALKADNRIVPATLGYLTQFAKANDFGALEALSASMVAALPAKHPEAAAAAVVESLSGGGELLKVETLSAGDRSICAAMSSAGVRAPGKTSILTEKDFVEAANKFDPMFRRHTELGALSDRSFFSSFEPSTGDQ